MDGANLGSGIADCRRCFLPPVAGGAVHRPGAFPGKRAAYPTCQRVAWSLQLVAFFPARNSWLAAFFLQLSSGHKKSPVVNYEAQRIWQLPTLPHFGAVPSAMRGLTTLFGMGRGEHPRQNHHKKVKKRQVSSNKPSRYLYLWLAANSLQLSIR